MNTKQIWTARCKSGYTFHGHACNKACKRGALLCDSCIDAVVVHSVPSVGLLSRVVGLLLAVLS